MVFERSIRSATLLCITLTGLPACTAMSPHAPGWIPEGVLEPPQSEPWLCRRDYLTPDQGKAILDAFLEHHPGREDWLTFAQQARAHILEGAGLDPLPRRTPLNFVSSKPRIHDGYTVQNVRFESIPGYWVTGNLYRPMDTGPHAAILHTHGHSSAIDDPGGWLRHGRFKDDVQARAATLARMGAVGLTIDMVGYGDSTQFLVGDVHHTPTSMRLQLWNAIRAIDFLSDLDGVDAGRIGVTGHSGGATQAILLTAVDSRVKACVPVAMVSAWFFGGCDCESGRPIHASDGFFMNNAMIAALAAPRPLKLISDGGDWTQHTPTIEFPFISAIYGRVGEGGIVTYTHLQNEGHNYGPNKRLAMYPFMAQFLGLDVETVQDSTGLLTEPPVTNEDPLVMRCFPEGSSIPDNCLRTEEQIKAVLQDLQQSQCTPHF